MSRLRRVGSFHFLRAEKRGREEPLGRDPLIRVLLKPGVDRGATWLVFEGPAKRLIGKLLEPAVVDSEVAIHNRALACTFDRRRRVQPTGELRRPQENLVHARHIDVVQLHVDRRALAPQLAVGDDLLVAADQMRLVDRDHIVCVVDRRLLARRSAPLLIGGLQDHALEMHFLMIRMKQQRSRRARGSLGLGSGEIEGQALVGVRRLPGDFVDLLAGNFDERGLRVGFDGGTLEVEVGHNGGVRRGHGEGAVVLIGHVVGCERAGRLQLCSIPGQRSVHAPDSGERYIEERRNFRQAGRVCMKRQVRIPGVAERQGSMSADVRVWPDDLELTNLPGPLVVVRVEVRVIQREPSNGRLLERHTCGAGHAVDRQAARHIVGRRIEIELPADVALETHVS